MFQLIQFGKIPNIQTEIHKDRPKPNSAYTKKRGKETGKRTTIVRKSDVDILAHKIIICYIKSHVFNNILLKYILN